MDGSIRIWDFHLGLLLKIKVSFEGLFAICLWNNNYLFVGYNYKEIKIIDFNNKKVYSKYY